MSLPALNITQAYHLDIQSLASPLSVFAFEAEEKLNSPYWVEIQVTCANPHLKMNEILGRKGRFSITPVIAGLPSWSREPLPAPRYFNGMITQFKKLRSNQEETLYSFRLEPRMAASLRPTQASRIIQHSSVPKIIEAILRHTAGGKNSGELALANGGLAGNDFAFKLRKPYPEREYTTQFNESDLAFINRLAEDVGMFYYFTQTDEAENLVFGDDLEFYFREQISTVLHEDAGLNSSAAESLHSLSTYYQQVPQTIQLNDYNYRAEDKPLLSGISVRQPDRTTLGRIYEYGEHYKTAEEGLALAKIRHEEQLAEQVVYHGTGNVRQLSAGSVFTLSNTTLPDAEFGLLVTSIRHSAARDKAYQNSFTAIPSHTLFRPKRVTPWPQINGTLSARIAISNTTDAYLDRMGRYIVAFDFDLDEWQPSNNSRRVRLAKPFAGGNETGFHFPLLEGTEVAIAFTNGDPDRPYIAHAMHDSSNPDHVTQSNPTRNIIRTQSNNKLRMEDRTSEEHIKLSTEFGGKSQLNLGHLVDAKKAKRGEGFELRSDSWGAIRAGKGLLLSAHIKAKASSKQNDMAETKALLSQALTLQRTLAEAAATARAQVAEFDLQEKAFKEQIDELKAAVLVASAPKSIAIASGEQMQLYASENIAITAGKQVDISAFKHFTVVAKEAISLFAHKLGMKLITASGKIEVQAQDNNVEITAAKDLLFTAGMRLVTGSQGETMFVGGGGSYIKLDNGNIELGCPGKLLFRTGGLSKQGPSSQSVNMPTFAKGSFDEKFVLSQGLTGKPLKQQGYRITFADGRIIEGITDEKGQTSLNASEAIDGMELVFINKDDLNED